MSDRSEEFLTYYSEPSHVQPMLAHRHIYVLSLSRAGVLRTLDAMDLGRAIRAGGGC